MPKPSTHELTDEHLRMIMPNAPKARRVEALPILNSVMAQYEINNERRAAAWLATLAVESGELKYQQEIASGAAYEGREDLGNTEPGDGKRFKGRGRIQLTGRYNHKAYTDYLRDEGHLPFVDFVKNPSRLAEEPYATDSAGWFWTVLKNLNPLADRRQFLKTQIAVNGRNRKTGKPNHWDVRQNYYERALRVLPDDFLLEGADLIEDVDSADLDEVDTKTVNGQQTSNDASTPQINVEHADEVKSTPQPIPGATKDDEPMQASQGGRKSTIAVASGAVFSVLTAVWAWLQNHASLAMVAVICITSLLVVWMFRQLIMDYIRMNYMSDPTRLNVK